MCIGLSHAIHSPEGYLERHKTIVRVCLALLSLDLYLRLQSRLQLTCAIQHHDTRVVSATFVQIWMYRWHPYHVLKVQACCNDKGNRMNMWWQVQEKWYSKSSNDLNSLFRFYCQASYVCNCTPNAFYSLLSNFRLPTRQAYVWRNL